MGKGRVGDAAIKSSDVLAALRRRHSGDVFVPECNLGSATQGCRRIDAWAMPKSWVPIRTIGYEIKVSRSDWTRDKKWFEYGEFVHELWVVCPWEMIEKSEIPDGIGLLWMNKGGKLIAKKRPVRNLKPRGVLEVMAYVLMSRSTIERPTALGLVNPATVEDWLEWAKGHDEHREVVNLVSDKIERMVGKVRDENLELSKRARDIDRIRDALTRVGLDPDKTSKWNIDSKVAELQGMVKPSTLVDMRTLGDSLIELAMKMEGIGKTHE